MQLLEGYVVAEVLAGERAIIVPSALDNVLVKKLLDEKAPFHQILDILFVEDCEILLLQVKEGDQRSGHRLPPVAAPTAFLPSADEALYFER